MYRHLGYVGSALSLDVSSSRTCRLRSATPDRLRQLIDSNLAGLRRILEFNVQQGICFYRISSRLIPFASHPVNRLSWWEEFATQLNELGRFIARHGLRVSMHPGQFTVLNTPDQAVLQASLREVAWHVRLLDSLGTSRSSKIILHGGGLYGEKRQAIDRLARVVRSLPDHWQARLAIENDERLFSPVDVLELARLTGLPAVFDWLHARCNDGGQAIDATFRACLGTWRPEDGLAEVHFSSQLAGGRPGQHAEWIDPLDFADFVRRTRDCSFDCMLEAKRRDLALLRLRRELGV